MNRLSDVQRQIEKMNSEEEGKKQAMDRISAKTDDLFAQLFQMNLDASLRNEKISSHLDFALR